MVTREGDTIELQCQVTGKPKPIILWSRADKEVAMPDGSMQMESYDGTLRIVNVSREMSGMYRCQTSQYNGFNVKPREALVQLIVQCEYMFFYVFLLGGRREENWVIFGVGLGINISTLLLPNLNYNFPKSAYYLS